MAETILNFVTLLVVVGFAGYEASSENIAMTAYACTLLVLYSLLWKLDIIEKRVKRVCELLEREGDDGED
nr:MAG TPA: Heme exporter protein D (CcmD) [Caudoviricetes sp.]